MHTEFHNAITWAVFLMAIFWLFFISRFFKLLKKKYPDKYEGLGSPGIFSNNTPSTNKGFLVFLFSKNKLFYKDKDICRSILFMRVWLFLFFVLFIIALSI